jgi:hypothetical protein
MDKTEIGAGLYVKEGFIDINSKNCVNGDDRHDNSVTLVVDNMVQFLCETIKR